MNLKCIVVDDDATAVETLSDYINAIPGLYLYKTFTQPLEALSVVNAEDTALDIIFMDIEMPGMSGMELADRIRNKTKHLVFTTAHTQYSLDAFGLRASQYFLKPFSFQKFSSEMQYLLQQNSEVKHPADKKIRYIKGNHKHDFIPVKIEDILYAEALMNYTSIFFHDQKLTVYSSLKEVKNLLNDAGFIQINRSVIIRKNAIEKISGNEVILRGGITKKICNTYKKTFFDYISKNSFRIIAH